MLPVAVDQLLMLSRVRSISKFIAAVRTSAIDAKNKPVGFQGDFTLDKRVVIFQSGTSAKKPDSRPRIGMCLGTSCRGRDRSGGAHKPTLARTSCDQMGSGQIERKETKRCDRESLVLWPPARKPKQLELVSEMTEWSKRNRPGFSHARERFASRPLTISDSGAVS